MYNLLVFISGSTTYVIKYFRAGYLQAPYPLITATGRLVGAPRVVKG